MVFCVSENVIKILLEARHIRACIIISFSVQAFLTIFAPLRKCLGGKWGIFFHFFIWFAYLLADWIATFTIGSISLINLIRSSSENDDIQVFWFWAPFLLLHLGGPDTITAFALQDNELWVRHLVGLIFQVGSTLYVFLASLPDNKLWLPTLLVLIAGIIKYAERNYAFYLASFDHFGDNWVPAENLNFYSLPGEQEAAGTAGFLIPVQFKNMGNADSLHTLGRVDNKIHQYTLQRADNNIHQYFAASDRESIVKAAVYLFGTIRRPLVRSFLSSSQLMKSFANLASRNIDSSAKEALQKIEIELSLLYEVLHTKWPVVVSKLGFVCRTLDIGCIVGASVLFSLFNKHYKLEEFDIWLTYVLLIGALALDFISLILLFVLSDWFFIAYFHRMKSVEDFINRRRWSGAVPQLNFIKYVVNDHPSWVKRCLSLSYQSWVKRSAKMCLSWVKNCLSLSYLRWVKKCLSWVKNCLSLSYLRWVKKCLSSVKKWAKKCLSWVKKWVKKWLSLSSQNFREDDSHWRFIFEQVESFSKSEPISIGPYRDWFTMSRSILEDNLVDREQDIDEASSTLWNIMGKYDFTRSLLILHIATELFLQHDPSRSNHRRTCKILSDYLFYLAMTKSTLIAPMLDSWEKVFNDTYEETKSVLGQSSSEILSDNINWEHSRREDLNGSVLFLALDLVRALREHRYPQNRYDAYDYLCKILGGAWVHLMAHAASNSGPNVHAQQPSKGGELLTFIWLCIANSGERELNHKMTRIQLPNTVQNN